MRKNQHNKYQEARGVTLIVFDNEIVSSKPVLLIQTRGFSFKNEIQDFREEMGERFSQVDTLLAKYEQELNSFKEQVHITNPNLTSVLALALFQEYCV